MPWVDDYVRADGTKVRGYSRWAPGARNEMAKFVLFGLLVLGVGGGTAATTSGSVSGELPKPKSSVLYPITFSGQNAKPAPRPTPTVSYPIPWDRSR